MRRPSTSRRPAPSWATTRCWSSVSTASTSPRLKRTLVDRGFASLLSEGGPQLLRGLLAEGVVDELDLTVVPRLLAGEHPRITNGPPVDLPLTLALLLEDGGTLLGRWLT